MISQGSNYDIEEYGSLDDEVMVYVAVCLTSDAVQ